MGTQRDSCVLPALPLTCSVILVNYFAFLDLSVLVYKMRVLDEMSMTSKSKIPLFLCVLLIVNREIFHQRFRFKPHPFLSCIIFCNTMFEEWIIYETIASFAHILAIV